MQDKYQWMTAQAAADDMQLSEDEIVLILAYDGDVDGYSDAEIDYVLELNKEWLSRV